MTVVWHQLVELPNLALIGVLALESLITFMCAYVCVFPFAVNALTGLTAMREGRALIEGFQRHTLINTPRCDVDSFTPQTFIFGHEICFGGNSTCCFDVLEEFVIFSTDELLNAKQCNWFSGC